MSPAALAARHALSEHRAAAAGGSPPVSGYAAWYDATQITGQADGSLLSTWPDSSGNGHTLTQATPAQQPNYYSSTAGRLVNGKPAVWFGGPAFNRSSLLTASFAAITANTVLIVAQLNQAVNPEVMVNGDGGAGPTISDYVGGSPLQWSIGWGANVYPGGINADTALHCFIATFNGAASALNIDGTSYGPVSLANTTVSTLTVGAFYATQYFVTGPICEVIIYNAVLTAPQQASLHTYVQTKWGTP